MPVTCRTVCYIAPQPDNATRKHTDMTYCNNKHSTLQAGAVHAPTRTATYLLPPHSNSGNASAPSNSGWQALSEPTQTTKCTPTVTKRARVCGINHAATGREHRPYMPMQHVATHPPYVTQKLTCVHLPSSQARAQGEQQLTQSKGSQLYVGHAVAACDLS